MNLEKVLAALRAKTEDLERLAGEISAAETAKDPAKTTTLTAQFDAAKSDCDALEKRAVELKALADRRTRLSAMQLAAKAIPADPPANTIGIIPAEAKADQNNEDALVGDFLDFLGGKVVSDQARTALSPRGEVWRDDARAGLRMPRGLASRVFPGLCGKALPLVSGVAPGASLLQQEFRPELVSYSPTIPSLFPLCRRWPALNGRVIAPQLTQAATADGEFGGVTFGWTAEGADAPETEPAIGQLNVPCYQAKAYTELTGQLISRSAASGFDVEALLRDLFGGRVSRGIDQAILTGTGVNQPTGILALAGLRTAARQQALRARYQDLLALEALIPPGARSRCVWAMQDAAFQDLRNERDAANNPLWVTAAGGSFVGGPQGRLLGYPVFTNWIQPALGTLGDVILFVTDQYVVGIESDIVIASSKDYRFRQGLTSYVAFASIGGAPGQALCFAALL